MKKTIALVTFLIACTNALAFTFMNGGVLYGTVCRSGIYFTSYPANMAQPVGSTCPVRDGLGNIMMYGIVTME